MKLGLSYYLFHYIYTRISKIVTFITLDITDMSKTNCPDIFLVQIRFPDKNNIFACLDIVPLI